MRRGVRLDSPETGRDFRVDRLVTFGSNKVRWVARDHDNYGTPRRFVSFSGLRLAADLARNARLLYLGAHFIDDTLPGAIKTAKGFSHLTADEMRSGAFMHATVTSSQIKLVESLLPGGDVAFEPDVRSVGLVAELRPEWGCVPDETGRCIGALALPEALTVPSYSRLLRTLDLYVEPPVGLQ